MLCILTVVLAHAIPTSPPSLAIWIDAEGILRRTDDRVADGKNSRVIASGVSDAAYDRKLDAVAYVSAGTLTVRLFGHARASVPANARRVSDGFEIRTTFRPTRGRLTWWTQLGAVTFTSGTTLLEVRGTNIIKGHPDDAPVLISADHIKRALTGAKESVWGASYRPNGVEFAFICGGDLWFGSLTTPLTTMEENGWFGTRRLALSTTDAGTKALNEAAEALDTVWSDNGKWLAVSVFSRKVFDRHVIIVDASGKEIRRVRGEFPVPWGDHWILVQDGKLVAYSPTDGRSRELRPRGWTRLIYLSPGFDM